jgi:hypothetical protein
MTFRCRFLALPLACLPAAALAGDYLGTLKLPKAAATGEIYSFSSLPLAGQSSSTRADEAFRLKLGYKYSRYLAVEGELNDVARAPANVFASPVNLASQFRATGFGVDTVATLPLWRFSFYGRMGAYHGDARYPFATYSTSLLGDTGPRTHWRYGLGVRYDITSALGIRAQVERYSPLGSPLAGETDGDLFSVGVSWRF